MLFLPSFVIALAGLVYPAFCSSKALQEKDIETATQWLAYWIIYTAFTTMEAPLSSLLYFIPLYPELKMCFILWLQLPYFQGAQKYSTRGAALHTPSKRTPPPFAAGATWLYKMYLEKFIGDAAASELMDQMKKAAEQLKTKGLDAEQIRAATEWAKAKVASLQKKPPVDEQKDPPVEVKKEDAVETSKDK